MRIALDGRWLHRSMHGIARYTARLIQNLPLQPQDHLVILYHREQFEPFKSLTGAQALWLDLPVPLFDPREAVYISGLLRDLQPDLLHVPAYWKPYFAPCPWLLTIHDLIHLQNWGRSAHLKQSLKHRLYYALLRQNLRGRVRVPGEGPAAGLLTVSQTSAQGIRSWLGEDTELPIQVTHLGVDAAYSAPSTQQEAEAPEPYFLYVGNPKPHKNAALILRAFADFAATYPDCKLYALGLSQEDARHLSQQQNCSWLQVLDFCPEADLPQLYRQALALLVPSRQEGFGLPAIEAMACGTPVLASDIPVHREVLGTAAVLLSPEDPEAWGAALRRFYTQPAWRLELAQAGSQQVQRYRWQKLAMETYAFYGSSLS